MTETTDTSDAPPSSSRGRGGLSAKLMPELKAIASGLGIKTAGMKKADLVGAITNAQSGGQSGDRSGGKPETRSGPPAEEATPEATSESAPEQPARRERGRRRTSGEGSERAGQPDQSEQGRGNDEQPAGGRTPTDGGKESRQAERHKNDADAQQPTQQSAKQQDGHKQNNKQDNKQDSHRQDNQSDRSDNHHQQDHQHDDNQHDNQHDDQNGDQGGGRRNRRRRGRDRDRPQTGNNNSSSNSGNSSAGGQTSGGRGRNEPDTQILEDDVLTPCAGILDVLDNYAFVRTSGYLPGADDVYVSLSMVRKLGLRRGDAITGQVRQPREGERKEKFNPLVAIDSVNGGDPEAARTRVEFDKLTPLYPSERLRLETDPTNLTGRIIDLAAPLGKGQRGLVVSPAKAGKTTVLKSIAGSITRNNPECHLMVVLVDERPEEVTDFERSVNGEVIASTFDRPAVDHTTVAELAIERAKRLVELGHDVVVLLDGITRLGRAYNLSAPASGRILSGGVDSAALYPPKRFFGAARNIENGGSLTIVATALVESGSRMDEVIFEEFHGTANAELRLRGDLADRRIFPAIDAFASGTRREELLMSEQELAIVWKLRRVLSTLEGEKALELLLERLRKARTNHEFLMSVQKSAPQPGGANGE